MPPNSDTLRRRGCVTAHLALPDDRRLGEHLAEQENVRIVITDEDGDETTVTAERTGYSGKATIEFRLDHSDLSEQATGAVADALSDRCQLRVAVEGTAGHPAPPAD